MPLLEKNTNQDKLKILSQAVQELKERKNGDHLHSYVPWLLDFDEQYVYFDSYNGTTYNTYRTSYVYNGSSATLGTDRVSVVRMTEYREVLEDSRETELVSLLKSFLKNFGPTEEKFPKQEMIVLKEFNEEQRIAYEPFYILPDTVDQHGDTISLEETKLMVKSFMEAKQKHGITGNFFHKIDTDKFEIEKVWVNEVESKIGETVVPEGLPIAKVKFNCEKAWEQRKQGKLSGLSIKANAEWEDVND